MDVQDGETVLFVGEGNFSFSLAVARLLNESSLLCQLFATCHEKDAVSDLAEANMAELAALGANVMLGVDATKLQETFSSRVKFDRIVFMFPHVGGKMKIGLNRALIKAFGESASSAVRSASSRVVVALCAGQGGTDLDVVKREEANSWQVVKMMAHGGFQLVDVRPFDGRRFEGYLSFGYRSMNKGFGSGNALLHIFELNPLCQPSQVSEHFFQEHKLAVFSDEKSRPGILARELLKKFQDSGTEVQVCDPIWTADLERVPRPSTPRSVRFVVLFTFSHTFEANPIKLYLQLFGFPKGEDLKQHLDFDFSIEKQLEDSSFVRVCHMLPPTSHWRELWTLKPSLCPPEYSHDLSFWLNDDIDETILLEIVWGRAGDFIRDFEWLERSFSREGRRSATVRIRYKAHAFAMSPEACWNVHLNIVGRALEEKFGVQIR